MRKDFACLYTQERDAHGNLKQTGCMRKFEETVKNKLSELEYNATSDSTTTMYEKICTAIHAAMDANLPTRRRGTSVRRSVSERTKDLFKSRTALRKSGTKEQFAQVQKRIKESSLADYTAWVQEWATEIGNAESIGDTRGVHNGVKALARKRHKPPTNLNTDSAGNMLNCAEDVAATWHRFLQAKFAATAEERARPQLESLPCTKDTCGLSEAQFLKGLHKMKTGKAVGPDMIPTKLFKHSQQCQTLLRQLIQKI